MYKVGERGVDKSMRVTSIHIKQVREQQPWDVASAGNQSEDEEEDDDDDDEDDDDEAPMVKSTRPAVSCSWSR